MTATLAVASPFAQAAESYFHHGWVWTLPLQAGEKERPPNGYTGHNRRPPSPTDRAGWANRPGANIGLGMPEAVIGIDVDVYDDKHGDITIAEYEGRFGPLPDTWTSTRRGPGPSRIRFYRVPPGLWWPGKLHRDGVVDSGVETVVPTHRYAVVWPSTYKDCQYRWYRPDGTLADEGVIPKPGELTELPVEWVAGLTGGRPAVERGPGRQVGDAEGSGWLREHDGEPCPAVAVTLAQWTAVLPGGRHDGLHSGLVALTKDGHAGHVGAGTAAEALIGAFDAEMAKHPRSPDPDEAPRALRNVLGYLDGEQAHGDPCELFGGLLWAERKRAEQRERVSVSTAPIETEPAENPLREFLLSEGEVLAMRRPECLIADTLDRGTVGVLSARFGAFKSFLCLDWLLSTAYGVPWHGRATTPGPVLYVVAEGAWGQGERIRAWKEAQGITETSANFHMLRIPVQLGDAERVSLLCRLVSELGAVLVIVDTFGKSTRGIEENSNTQVHLAIESLERVRDATPDGAGVVLTAHHSEKNPNDLTGLRSSRGAGAIEDDVDTVYQLTKNDDGTVTASRTKRKDGPTEDVWVITSEPVGSSLSLSYSDTTAAAVADAKVPAQRVRYERNVERARGLLDEGRAVTVAQVAARCEVTKPPAQGYLDQLVEVGEASVTVDAHKVRWYSSAGGP